MNTSAVDSQPLGAFFEGYRKKSLLPDPVLDYMLEIYKARNTQPMAGHGSLNPPTVDAAQATVLCELTKSIVRIERSLAEQAIDLRKAAIPQKTSATPGPPASQQSTTGVSTPNVPNITSASPPESATS